MSDTRKVAIIGAILLVVAGLVALWLQPSQPEEVLPEVVIKEVSAVRSIGSSVEGRSIEAFSFGEGEKEVVLVGGIHGGYEWNSVLLAYAFMDHFAVNPSLIPEGVRVTVIPNANPDGVFKVVQKEGRFYINDVPVGDVSAGRFNARGVDLNRNFDCKWQPEASWRGSSVSAGTAAFSEPEAQALRDFFVSEQPKVAVFLHSQAGAVYASECMNGVLPETLASMQVYAEAAGYAAVPSFNAYPVTGDIEGWLASVGIPAITVELTTHTSLEWEKNRAGVEALLRHVGGV